jgi:hypothetical protein
LSAVINAADVDATAALRVMRVVSERIPIPAITPEEAAFERVRLRSLGVEEKIRSAEGGGLSDAEFAARLGLGSRETVRQYLVPAVATASPFPTVLEPPRPLPL